ncbi:hypothetical protein ABPG72_016874 [Tetrahymena utriculariae]
MDSQKGFQFQKQANQEENLKEIDYLKEHLESEGSENGQENKQEEKYNKGIDEIEDEEKSNEGQEQGSEEVSEDNEKDIFLSENPYQQVNKNNLLGVVTYVKWMRNYQYYFGLDMQRGYLLLYKKPKQQKFSTYYSLIKGRFEDDSEYQLQDGDDVIRIRNKKGRKFRLQLYENKDPKKIRELIEVCFSLQIQSPSKGFYATLGRSVMMVFNHPFNVFSGIIVDMKKTNKGNENKKKQKQMKEKMSKLKGYTALSSLFFNQSDLLKEILGSISGFILNPFNSKALSESFSSAHFVIGLVFKPISGTIDIIGKSIEYKKDHIIHGNVFKVYKILKKKQSNKKTKKEEKERSKREAALEIHSEFMEKVYENEDEVLYLNKNNQLGITKKDIVQLSSLAKGLNLEDVDHTIKQDIQYDQQKVKMNKLLEYYIKNRKEKSEEYEEDMCEFIVLQPIIDKSVRSEKILKGLDEEPNNDQINQLYLNISENQEEQIDGDIEELVDEIGDESIGHSVNKNIPFTINYHQSDKKELRETFNTNMPEFIIRDSPFKNGSTPKKIYLEDIAIAQDTKYVEAGQLKIPFTSKLNLDAKQYNDTDDEMQFHSFVNQNENNSIDPFNPVNLALASNQIGNDNQNTLKPQFDQDKENLNIKLENSNRVSTSKFREEAQELSANKQKQEEEIVKPADAHQEAPKNQSEQTNHAQQELQIQENKNQPSAEKEESEDDEEEEEEEDQGIAKAQDTNKYFTGNKADLLKTVEGFQILSVKDENRHSESHPNGGKQCQNKEIINTTRSVGKLIIKEIGRKIISGDFNLTQVSFPIKAMIPKSALQTALTGTCLFPIYMAKASQTNDYVERFKLLITATFANFPVANTFLKPLNPILGETFQATYVDGTKLYGEQVSHHPPVSYFLAEGPNKSYLYSGYYLYEAKAGWNSLTLKNKGKRSIVFKDGQKINYNFGYEYYSGTFMGTMKHETLGQIDFIDPVNKIEATIITGKVKKKPSDYLQGDIKVNGKVVSSCFGSYLGFMEFDGKRYWDHRYVLPIKMNVVNSPLQSDHQKRTDRKFLAQAQLKKAQEEKERLEGIQRNDAKLRKKYQEKVEKQLKTLQKQQKANKKK